MTANQLTNRRIKQLRILRHDHQVNAVVTVRFQILDGSRFLATRRAVRPYALNFIKNDERTGLFVIV